MQILDNTKLVTLPSQPDYHLFVFVNKSGNRGCPLVTSFHLFCAGIWNVILFTYLLQAKGITFSSYLDLHH